jgi:hypothetical protein
MVVVVSGGGCVCGVVSSTQAFDHVAGVINDVYEELTKDAAHPHGGTASLSVTEHSARRRAGGHQHVAWPLAAACLASVCAAMRVERRAVVRPQSRSLMRAFVRWSRHNRRCCGCCFRLAPTSPGQEPYLGGVKYIASAPAKRCVTGQLGGSNKRGGHVDRLAPMQM